MQITLDSPLDMHLHLRDDDMLKTVAPLSARDFSAAIVMPNIVPPITTIQELKAYKKRIQEASKRDDFEPLMTLFFKSSYDFDFLKEAKEHIKAVKLYPAGITTNSEGGVSSIDEKVLAPTLEAMSELDIPLSIHGETNGFVIDREKEFLPIYEKLAKSFPRLKIIMEHITTKEAVKTLYKYENLYATITVHHLYITLDDVIGGMLQPHLFCKPIAKAPDDRKALLELALKADKKVMFGSDSAPHPRSKKESLKGAAGVFTAPIILPALAELFEKHNSLQNLQAFISDNARAIYNYTPKQKLITLEKKEFIVPSIYKDIVPMFANKTFSWSVV